MKICFGINGKYYFRCSLVRMDYFLNFNRKSYIKVIEVFGSMVGDSMVCEYWSKIFMDCFEYIFNFVNIKVGFLLFGKIGIG